MLMLLLKAGLVNKLYFMDDYICFMSEVLISFYNIKLG